MNMTGIEEMLFVLKELIRNGILLFGLGFIYTLSNYGINRINQKKKIYLGGMIGFIAILVMMFPFQVQPGLFFDARGVLYSISGLFFGGIPTLVAAIIGIAFRVNLGGAGVYSGVATIIVTSLLGIAWRNKRLFLQKLQPVFDYYLLGLATSILTLTCFLLIPNPWPLIIQLIPAYLLVFPFVSVVLAQIFNIQKERAITREKIKQQQLLLQASMDALDSTELFSLDRQLQYLSFNQKHAEMMKKLYAVQISLGKSYLDCLTNTNETSRYRAFLKHALAGGRQTIVYQEDKLDRAYFEKSFAPITEENGRVIGVTVMIKDISEAKRYEMAITNLSYNDPLTKIGNRRFYDEKFDEFNQPQFYPLSIISMDINGLKIINDAFGHHVGDELLCNVASHLQVFFNHDGTVARIGGDEFAVILPNHTYEEAESKMQAFQQILSTQKIHDIHISGSFGLATRIGQKVAKSSLEQLSDDEMYRQKFANSSQNRQRVIQEVLQMLFRRCKYEESHVKVMEQVVAKLGQALSYSDEAIANLQTLCQLHDIGKVTIDTDILQKTEGLTEAECNIIRKHPERGYRILVASVEYKNLALDVFCHHENYDGSGYPRRLAGEAIPFNARILAIAEAYSAMVCEGSYQPLIPPQEAVIKIEQGAGKQFDPHLTKIFVSIYKNS